MAVALRIARGLVGLTRPRLGDSRWRFLITTPEIISSDGNGFGRYLLDGREWPTRLAAAPTSGILAAAQDEVSIQIAAMFSQYAGEYQRLQPRYGGLSRRVRAGPQHRCGLPMRAPRPPTPWRSLHLHVLFFSVKTGVLYDLISMTSRLFLSFDETGEAALILPIGGDATSTPPFESTAMTSFTIISIKLSISILNSSPRVILRRVFHRLNKSDLQCRQSQHRRRRSLSSL